MSDSPNAITARYRWTADDLLLGRKLVLRDKPWLRLNRMVVPMIVLAACYYILHDDGPAAIAVGMIFPIAIIILLPRFISPLLVRRQFAKRPDANMEIEWTISERGIRTSSASSKSEIAWSAFQTVLSTPDGFLFMPNRQIFHFLPKRAFETTEAIENLKQLVRQCATEFKELK